MLDGAISIRADCNTDDCFGCEVCETVENDYCYVADGGFSTTTVQTVSCESGQPVVSVYSGLSSCAALTDGLEPTTTYTHENDQCAPYYLFESMSCLSNNKCHMGWSTARMLLLAAGLIIFLGACVSFYVLQGYTPEEELVEVEESSSPEPAPMSPHMH